ncbi:MAG: hypothetical protein H0U74_08280 [Bradymonadaceae bacterium]|nr:hypothetical protein [Lujinxingiaceae bacterium]
MDKKTLFAGAGLLFVILAAATVLVWSGVDEPLPVEHLSHAPISAPEINDGSNGREPRTGPVEVALRHPSLAIDIDPAANQGLNHQGPGHEGPTHPGYIDQHVAPEHLAEHNPLVDSDRHVQRIEADSELAELYRRENPLHNDPINHQVLGRPEWMATLPAVDEASIDAVIDAAHQRRMETEALHEDRRAAIDRADTVALVCAEELLTRAPDANGHIIINFELDVLDNGQGFLDSITIVGNANLADMAYENCIVTELAMARFQATSRQRLWVEHAIFVGAQP